MVQLNEQYDRLPATYLFSEIGRRTQAFQAANPDVKLMRLGIGNTTEPLTPSIIAGLQAGVTKLASRETYTGYGAEQGNKPLREAIATQIYTKREVLIEHGEIFVSDGAKCDSANIGSIFGLENIVAVQDPAYPVYVDTNIIAGRNIVYMPCPESNGFFPHIPKTRVDLIYLCSPNNPTGAVATKQQLQQFVNFARNNDAIIIYDAAYSSFIRDTTLPQSIYEIPGSKECAIEINSFSKSAGFTGVRLGWTVVPLELTAHGIKRGKIHSLWNRRQTTFFNGASNIVQEGGLAALGDQGQKECRRIIDYYMGNAAIIKAGLTQKGLRVHGGENAPYLWIRTQPQELTSWQFFDRLLNEAHVVSTPGSGFGPGGEGYLRLSAFGHREDIEAAVHSIQNNLKVGI